MPLRATLLLLLSLAACAPPPAPVTTPQPAGASAATPHNNLDAVLWMQTSVEFEASAVQAYQLARIQLDAALQDPSRTAAIEQTGGFSRLPPAVILDVDETVLDNSFYQARLIRDGLMYSPETWDPWVEEARATAIPGALDFVRYAANRGVAIFYVTNRTANLEAATRRNLQALGFPLDARVDTVLTRGERPEWKDSAKGPRRAHVAREYRILLLVGDDLGDFVENPAGTPDQRRAHTEPNAHRWGRDWIMIPNPTYGSWERAIVASSQNPAAAKRQALRYQP